MAYASTFGDRLTDLLGSIVSVAARVVIFLLILGIGWIIAHWLRKLTGQLLHAVGFDRAVERGGLKHRLGDRSGSDLVGQLVAFALMLFVLQLAFGVFGNNAVSEVIRAIINWLPKLFVAVVIVVLALAAAGWVRDVITDTLGGTSYGRTVAATLQWTIVGLAAIAALSQVGVANAVIIPILITALATVGGVLVVGLGGGLIKPMQHRWERMLNRAETETTLATERIRARRARTDAERGVAEPAGRTRFSGEQPPYRSDTGVVELNRPATDQPAHPEPPPER
jgi:mechanosensitive ion channel-like protein